MALINSGGIQIFRQPVLLQMLYIIIYYQLVSTNGTNISSNANRFTVLKKFPETVL